MRLITTCPSCETSFRVVADQLKLHRGMVRCGKCQTVFSGIERLRQIPDPESAGPAAPNPPPPAASEPVARPDRSSGRPAVDLDSPPPPIGRPEAVAPTAPDAIGRGVGKAIGNHESVPGPALDEASHATDPVPASSAPADPVEVFRKPPGRRLPPTRAHSTSSSEAPAPPVLVTEPDDDDLRLARELEDAAREIAAGADDEQAIDFFSTERKRGGLLARHGMVKVGAAALLTIALAVQGLLASRHYLVARLPALEPAMAMLAGSFGLPIELPEMLDALSIESFELQQTDAPGLFSVAAIIRNEAGHAVRWPSMLLTLTDPVNRVLVRKAIHPSDFLDPGAIPGGLRARSERPVRIALEVSELQPAGYSVVLFYR